jgi:hypothetical protein
MVNPKEICVLVSYNETYAPMAEISVQDNIKKYCEIHGYYLWIDIHEQHYNKENSTDWDIAYRKIQATKDILKTNQFKWVVYIDTDSLIMNPNIKLESFLDDNYSCIVLNHKVPALDNPITSVAGLNNVIISHFFVKNSEDGLNILDAWLGNEGWPKNLPTTEWDLEGRQMRILINNPKYTSKIKAMDEGIFSRFWYSNNPFLVFTTIGLTGNIFRLGDFIVHVIGYGVKERIQLLSDLNYFSGLQKKVNEKI